jgi:hypothetical protein
MKTLVAMVTTVLVVGAPGSANGQVPESYRGVWVINAAGTASRIASDPSMAPENKPGWTERWLASGAGLDITSDEISLHGLEGGSISLAVTLAEDIVDGTLVSAIFPSPSGQEGMRVSLPLRVGSSHWVARSTTSTTFRPASRASSVSQSPASAPTPTRSWVVTEIDAGCGLSTHNSP